jgi:TRAP-type C4-dicarboxylate transport system permease small subunit
MSRLIAAIYNPVVKDFGSGDGGVTTGLLMARLYRTAILVGGLAMLLFIAWGGLNWVTAGGDEKKVEAAKDKITNGIIGMVVLVGTAALAGFIGEALGLNLLSPSL